MEIPHTNGAVLSRKLPGLCTESEKEFLLIFAFCGFLFDFLDLFVDFRIGLNLSCFNAVDHFRHHIDHLSDRILVGDPDNPRRTVLQELFAAGELAMPRPRA